MRLFDHSFGANAIIRAPVSPRVRYVAHGDDRIDVEHRDEVALILNLTANHRVSGRLDGTFRSEIPLVNSVTVMPPGCRFQFQIEGACRVLAVMLSIDRTQWTGDAPGVEPRLNAFDPEVASLVWRTATIQGDQSDAALSLLADHLLHPAHRRIGPMAGGIAASRLRRVLDFIEAGIAGPLPLADLASIAGMSSFHFARAFAASTGSSPHRYVVGRRVARAITALDENRSGDDVAMECGFANISHMGHHVRRVTGTTPRQVRQLTSGGLPAI
ncbi:AraC family transcriptional regulator [Roseomonas mucosa]